REISEQRNYSDEVAYEIDKEIHDLINDAYLRAKDVLTDNMDKLEAITMLLLEHETIDGSEIEALFDDPRPIPTLHGPIVIPEGADGRTQKVSDKEKDVDHRPEPTPPPRMRPQPAS
ncbi:MAG TPA: cell division protein FtsH, partial [Nitrolancea sp.]|nr:cell division protein FtsH [Nitrolancea sp.]